MSSPMSPGLASRVMGPCRRPRVTKATCLVRGATTGAMRAAVAVAVLRVASSSCRDGQRPHGLTDLRVRFRERLGFRRVAHREAFGVDELHVADAEEAQEIAHVGSLRVERGAGVESAARGEDVCLLARDEALRALLGVAERD